MNMLNASFNNHASMDPAVVSRLAFRCVQVVARPLWKEGMRDLRRVQQAARVQLAVAERDEQKDAVHAQMAGARAILARHRNFACIESLAQAATIVVASDLLWGQFYALAVPSLVWGAARGLRATWALYILAGWDADAAADCVLTEDDDGLLDVRAESLSKISRTELQALYTNTAYNYLTHTINHPLQLMLPVAAAASAVSCGMKMLGPLWYYNTVPSSAWELYTPVGGAFACGALAVYSADTWRNQKRRAREFEEQCVVMARAIEQSLGPKERE